MCTSEFACFLCEIGRFLRESVRFLRDFTEEFAYFLCEIGGFLRGFVRFLREFNRRPIFGGSTVYLDEFRPNLTGNPVELRS